MPSTRPHHKEKVFSVNCFVCISFWWFCVCVYFQHGIMDIINISITMCSGAEPGCIGSNKPENRRLYGAVWNHDDQMETFSRYWPFVDVCDVFFICSSINGWLNNRETGDLRRHRAHYDATVMYRYVPTANRDSNVHRSYIGVSLKAGHLISQTFIKCHSIYV